MRDYIESVDYTRVGLHKSQTQLGEEQMKYTAQKDKKIEDGKHQGVIVAVETRTKPYEYTDVIIEADGIKLKAGYPSFLSNNSKLGQLFQRVGIPLVIGEEYDDSMLIGRKVDFMTITKGKYAEIITESVRKSA